MTIGCLVEAPSKSQRVDWRPSFRFSKPSPTIHSPGVVFSALRFNAATNTPMFFTLSGRQSTDAHTESSG